MSITQEQLVEWQGHHVTEYLLEGMGNHFQSVKESLKDDFWNGVEVDPKRFAIAQAYEQLFETLSDGSAEDFAGLHDE